MENKTCKKCGKPIYCDDEYCEHCKNKIADNVRDGLEHAAKGAAVAGAAVGGLCWLLKNLPNGSDDEN